MFALLTLLLGILLSTYVWGILRTALWLLPALFAPMGTLVGASMILSFLSACAFIVPIRQNCFDARELSREKKTLILFLSGLFSGTFFYPSLPSLYWFLGGAAFPLLFLLLCRLVRHPLPLVICRSESLKKWAPFAWSVCLLLELFEIR